MQVTKEVVDVSGVGIDNGIPFVHIGRFNEVGDPTGSISRHIYSPKELEEFLRWMVRFDCKPETFSAVLSQLAQQIQTAEFVDAVVRAMNLSTSSREHHSSGIKSYTLCWVRPANGGRIHVVHRGFGHDTDPNVARVKALNCLLQSILGNGHAHN